MTGQLPEPVRSQMATCGNNGDIFPFYCGPTRVRDRYLAGEVLTREDFLTDESEWGIFPMGYEDRRRLWWMLEHLRRSEVGEVVRFTPPTPAPGDSQLRQ